MKLGRWDNKMKKALIFGAGNIGRGFIGQLFCQSGYQVVFVDINETLIEAINREGKYSISIVSNKTTKEIIVSPVRGVDGKDVDAVVAEMLDIDLIATAVGMRALEKISKTIASGLRKRWEKGNFTPINIIICENMLNADKYMKEAIVSELNLAEQNYFKDSVGLVEASIGRMVPVAIQTQECNPLKVFVEEYDKLPVDKEGFKGEIPNINNMIPYSPFIYYIHRKLFMHNMGHAITAYLGSLRGYKYIWEAIEDPTIKGIAEKAFEESAKAISKEHKMPIEDLIIHAQDLIYRFGNRALGDTTERVARDPIRKLSADDRLAGAAILCIKHEILPIYICLGIAAGLLYTSPKDETALEIQRYIEERGIDKAITHFCSFAKQDIKHKLVLDFYNQLKSGIKLEVILSSINNKNYI
jgi:mannitol-1-phosphate 5-dehydrogenase